MIISEKYKYIFIGLPYSASSGISRELVEKYDGRSVLTKHANITEYIRCGGSVEKYTVFAVYRNPVDIVHTIYTKLVNNTHGVFTEEKYFMENGGWVSKKERARYQYVKENTPTFSEFVDYRYKYPYDSVYSLNANYLDYVINLDKIDEGFSGVLDRIGIDQVRGLPHQNRTENKRKHEMRNGLLEKVFGSYINEHEGSNLEVPVSSTMMYRLLKPFRYSHWRRVDIALSNSSIAKDINDVH